MTTTFIPTEIATLLSKGYVFFYTTCYATRPGYFEERDLEEIDMLFEDYYSEQYTAIIVSDESKTVTAYFGGED